MSEGRDVVLETIEYIKNQQSLPKLRWNKSLWKSCKDHVLDTGAAGTTSHSGSDGSSPFDRMARYARLVSPAGENLSFGPSKALDNLLNLIIDDGVPSRGHRTNIFNSEWKDAGIYFGSHTTYTNMMC